MDLLGDDKPITRNLISYSREPLDVKLQMMEILKTEDKKQSLIYYGILLTAGIFMKLSLYNFISLIYVYLLLKDDEMYKEITDFFERVIKYMFKRMEVKKDVNNFIRTIVSYKTTNSYLSKFEIKMDSDFLNNLYNLREEIDLKELLPDFIKTYNLLYLYLIEKEITRVSELEQILLYYFNTVLLGFKMGEEMEKMAIDLNGKMMKQLLEMNGGASSDRNPNLISQEDKDELIRKLVYINNFIKEFKDFKSHSDYGFVEKGIVDKYKNIINDLNNIEVEDKENKKVKQEISRIEYPDIGTNFTQKITQIKSQIKNNINKTDDYLEKYGLKEDRKESKSSEQAKVRSLEDGLKKITQEYIPYFDKFKSSNDVLIKMILGILNKKDDEDKEYLFDIIKKYLDTYKNIIREFEDELLKTSKTLKSATEIIKGLEDSYTNKIGADRRNTRDYDRVERYGGGDERFSSFDGIIEQLKKNNVDDKINKLETGIKKIKSSNIVKDSLEKDEALKGFVDSSNTNLFERMLSQYNTDVNNTIPEVAKAKLYEKVVENNLDTEIELEITLYDKLIFIFLIIVIRLIAMGLTNYFIDNDKIIVIQNAVYYYALIYTIIFVVIFMIINIDVFRLRLIFNYMNMHINSTGILIHIIIKIIISYIVYLLIVNIDTTNKPSRLSKHQKIKLKFKLEILTIAILAFIILFIMIV